MNQQQEDYQRQLKERQEQHLRNVKGMEDHNWLPCMHDACTECVGTGIKIDGSVCIHFISCPCPKCTPTY